MSNKLKRWLCLLNRHDWVMELRGHAYQGSVYPVRFRTCSQCQRSEQEIFDQITQKPGWIKIDKTAKIPLELLDL